MPVSQAENTTTDRLTISFRRKMNQILLRVVLLVTLLLHAAGLYQLILPVAQAGHLGMSRRWMAVLILGILLLVIEVGLLVVAVAGYSSWIMPWKKLRRPAAPGIGILADDIFSNLGRLGALNLLIYGLGILGCIYIGFFLPVEVPFILHVAAFWSVALLGSALLKAWDLHRSTATFQGPFRRHSWANYLGLSLLLTAFGYRIASFLPEISTYPFTLSWSEASRYYYASLFFSERIYGFYIPPTVLHPSRYLLQSLPFLIPNSPLWLHRAWQVFLWLSLPMLSAWLLVHRLRLQNQWKKILLFLGAFLFLLSAPVYYHLLVPVILMLWGFHPTGSQDDAQGSALPLILSTGAVLLASAWAGISRVNWYPMPGLLAAALYFLETPVKNTPASPASKAKSIFAYLVPPALWTLVGMGTAFVSQAIYILWSGNPTEQFTSSFSSDLLWYRLLPSSTYPVGVLPGILLVSLPLILMATAYLISAANLDQGQGKEWQRYHPIRLLGLLAILLALFGGGLVVSVKIGGGSNLHNMDAFMVLLLVTSAYISLKRFLPDQQVPAGLAAPRAASALSTASPLCPAALRWYGFTLGVVILAFFSIIARAPHQVLPDEKLIDKGLAAITRRTQEASKNGGEVLFISNRQLLTFHYVEGIKLIPEYERIFLMEMAMSNNTEYLDQFYRDLKNHRFALIVNEPLYLQEKDESSVFGEENNAWVERVSRYILCYYQEDRLARAVRVQMFVPNPNPNENLCPQE